MNLNESRSHLDRNLFFYFTLTHCANENLKQHRRQLFALKTPMADMIYLYSTINMFLNSVTLI